MATSPTATEAKLPLKLYMDKKSNKVVFAEAGKEFVDFLFSFLSFPLGTVINLLSKDQTLGCMGNLYKSVEDLDVSLIQPATSKDSYLKPKLQQLCTIKSNLLSIDGLGGTPAIRKFYKCGKCNNVTDSPQPCPHCQYYQMNTEVYFTGSDAVKNMNEGGFVKGGGNYMVMDDLEVEPLSTFSIVDLLKKLNIERVELKIVEIGMDEGVKLLKASLQSKTVLTSVFLGASSM